MKRTFNLMSVVLTLVFCFGSLLFWSSCSSDNSTPATLQVKLTDAPGDFDEVNIDIQDVQVNADENSNAGKFFSEIKIT